MESRTEPVTNESSAVERARVDLDRDGVALLRGLLRPSHLQLLGEGVETNRISPSPWAHWYTDTENATGFWTDYVTWGEVEPYRRVVFDSGIASVAAALMGSDTARFFHEHVLVKEPGATERTPWHHDQPYYCVDGDQNVSMWIALDPVPADAGMRFLAGSHRWGRWFIPRRFLDHESYAADTGRYEQVPDVDALIDADPDQRVLSFDVEPGDIVVFHFRTLHDAPANVRPQRRRAVSLRWVGDDARWAERPWQVSPPFEANGLAVGDVLDDERFPVVSS